MKRKYTIKWNAPVTIGLVILCFIATVAGQLTSGRITQLCFMTYRTSFMDLGMYVRLFTHVLGHSSWQHFIGNVSYLLLLGPLLEEKYGAKRMLGIILITAGITGLANNLLFGNVALCGASGIVFAFILLASFTNYREGEIPLSFVLVAVFYIGGQIYDAIFIRDHVSNLTHIIGGLIGAAIGYKIGKKKGY